MNQNPTTFYLVRHGQSESNIKGLVAGHWDVDLTDDGEIQAAIRGKTLKPIQFDLAFSSDLIRAKRTAEAIALEQKIAVQTTHLLRERNYGSLEGEKTEEEARRIRELFHEYWQVAYKDKHSVKLDPGMESNEEIMGRLFTFLRETAIAYAGKTILVVSHGDLILTLLSHLGYLDDKKVLNFENTGYVVLQSDGITFSVQQTEGLHYSSFI